MELESRKFLTAPKLEFKLDEQSKADVFKDQKIENVNDAVRVDLQDRPGQVLDYHKSKGRLIKYPLDSELNRQWRAKFIGQDLIVIQSGTDRKKCVTYLRDQNAFSLRKCQKKKEYKDQKFVVTKKDGTHNAFDKTGLVKKPKKDAQWGKCPTCLPGGFGSDLQKGEPSETDQSPEEGLSLEDSDSKEEESAKNMRNAPNTKGTQPRTEDRPDKDPSDKEEDSEKEDDDPETKKSEIPVGPSTRKGAKMLGDMIDKKADLDKEANPDQDSESTVDNTRDILNSDANPSTFPVLEVMDDKDTLCRIKFPNMQMPGSRNKKIPFALHVYKKIAE